MEILSETAQRNMLKLFFTLPQNTFRCLKILHISDAVCLGRAFGLICRIKYNE